jgi:hypothetical protein
VFEAENLTAIREPIVYPVWDPQHLTTMSASTACYGNSFTLYIFVLFFLMFFWVIVPCSLRMNERLGGTYLHLHGRKSAKH